MIERRCAYCGDRRGRPDLLRVTDLRTMEARYVCRPTLSPRCFTLHVRGAHLDLIEAAAGPGAGSWIRSTTTIRPCAALGTPLLRGP